MSEKLKWVYNNGINRPAPEKVSTACLSEQTIAEVVNFHRGFPRYAVTPLHSLDALAAELSVRKIWVKDIQIVRQSSVKIAFPVTFSIASGRIWVRPTTA